MRVPWRVLRKWLSPGHGPVTFQAWVLVLRRVVDAVARRTVLFRLMRCKRLDQLWAAAGVAAHAVDFGFDHPHSRKKKKEKRAQSKTKNITPLTYAEAVSTAAAPAGSTSDAAAAVAPAPVRAFLGNSTVSFDLQQNLVLGRFHMVMADPTYSRGPST